MPHALTRLAREHGQKLLGLFLPSQLVLLACLAQGQLKPAAEWVWIDILGEGGTALFILIWLGFIVISRPAGRITNLLVLGLSGVFLSMWVDTLDEFIRLPATARWDQWLESGLMPLGFVLLTWGLHGWQQEQRSLMRQLAKRERLFRDHRLYDKLLPLCGAAYLREQLRLELGTRDERQPVFSVLMLDLDEFADLNRRHGRAEGDRVLEAVAQILVLNLRHGDLLCRLAGDRFVALLPRTGETQAQGLAQELCAALACYAHKTAPAGERLHLSSSAAVVMCEAQDTPEGLLDRLTRRLLAAKERKPPLRRAS
ncbi:MAG: diguanylate cyclase [Gammaproteobacteria bacterium]|nr:diguanylate cyclase [Gammaproteobacteria bacterium]